VLDDLSTGKVEGLPEGIDLIVADVSHPEAVTNALDGCDACLHLAAVASVEKCTADWSHSTAINLLGTVNVFDGARHHGGIPVVYASSAAVYGDAEPPIAETALPRPLSSYGADKLGVELQAHAAWQVFALPTVGLRLFNVFGPGQDPNSPYSGVISKFTTALLAGEQGTIFGDGEQSRDFIYVCDVVEAASRAVRIARAGRVEANVVNICTGERISLRQLYAEMCALLGSQLEPRFGPARDGDIRHSQGEPGLALETLGFKAAVPLTTGLWETLRALAPETLADLEPDR
jgi:UDP-glucose 4-epimerase